MSPCSSRKCSQAFPWTWIQDTCGAKRARAYWDRKLHGNDFSKDQCVWGGILIATMGEFLKKLSSKMERPSSSEPIRLFPSIAVNVHMRKSITSLHLAAIDCRTSGKLCEAGCALSHVVAGLLPQMSSGVGEEIPQSRLRVSCLMSICSGWVL